MKIEVYGLAKLECTPRVVCSLVSAYIIYYIDNQARGFFFKKNLETQEPKPISECYYSHRNQKLLRNLLQQVNTKSQYKKSTHYKVKSSHSIMIIFANHSLIHSFILNLGVSTFSNVFSIAVFKFEITMTFFHKSIIITWIHGFTIHVFTIYSHIYISIESCSYRCRRRF